MTKLKFLPMPYIFRLRKPSTYMLLVYVLSFVNVDPYEKSVKLLKSRSRTLHPHMHYSYTGGRRKNMLSI